MKTEWKYITKTEHERYKLFIKRHTRDFSTPKSGPLYHYTSGETLIRIVQSRELWTTHIACLNDTKEFVYAFDRLREHIQARITSARSAGIEYLLQGLVNLVADVEAVDYDVFVSCFSEKDDDLSQWRAYSGGEGDYTIQFDPDALRKKSEKKIFLLRVEYSLEKQTKLLDSLLDELERIYVESEGANRAPDQKEWAKECISFWMGAVFPFATVLKHPAFSGEKEWRLVYPPPAGESASQFRQRYSMMSRHVPIKFGDRLPITGIRVGPCRYPDLSRNAVSDLLVSHGYDPSNCPVEVTTVPYRIP